MRAALGTGRTPVGAPEKATSGGLELGYRAEGDSARGVRMRPPVLAIQGATLAQAAPLTISRHTKAPE